MSSLSVQIFFILFLILANGIFAMSEIAIVSARKTRLQQLVNEGHHRAATALALAQSPNRFLATVQVGITLVGALLNAYSGATLADPFGAYLLHRYPALGDFSGQIALGVVVLVNTYLQVIIGELVPKALALHHTEKIAIFMAVPMKVLSSFTSPLVRLFEASTHLVLRLLGIKERKEAPVTGEEINVMVAQGTEAGVFDEVQQDMVESVIELNERRVSGIMTPRMDIVWIDEADRSEDLREKIVESPYSRFPVCRGGLDQVIGVIHTKDMLGDFLAGGGLDLKSHTRKILSVPETIPALKCLESFRQSGSHLALVIDEYGGVVGLVTMNDILEEIVGDVTTATDREEPEAVQREDGSWLIDGVQTIDDLKDTLGVDRLSFEDPDRYQTLGGFIMTFMERIPSAGDRIEADGISFEVMDMDGNRVDKVLVKRVEAPRSEEKSGEGAPGREVREEAAAAGGKGETGASANGKGAPEAAPPSERPTAKLPVVEPSGQPAS